MVTSLSLELKVCFWLFLPVVFSCIRKKILYAISCRYNKIWHMKAGYFFTLLYEVSCHASVQFYVMILIFYF